LRRRLLANLYNDRNNLFPIRKLQHEDIIVKINQEYDLQGMYITSRLATLINQARADGSRDPCFWTQELNEINQLLTQTIWNSIATHTGTYKIKEKLIEPESITDIIAKTESTNLILKLYKILMIVG
jgi:hypothetical protein